MRKNDWVLPLVLSVFSISLSSANAAQKLAVTSTAIKEGASIDKKYTEDGADFSPPLAWSKGPAGTKCYAISCEDPDAPMGTWWHWIIFNISPSTQVLGENVPKVPALAGGVEQGSNDFRKIGYNGPAPPPGKVHHYLFKVVALDTLLNFKGVIRKEAYADAIKGHVLAEGQLTGVYKR
jgi:Raf kinase inhibitor-like YbhB/YbcL family protein